MQSLLQMTSRITTLRPLRVRQTTQISPLFQTAVNESPRVLIQCTVVDIKFLLYLQVLEKLVSFGSQKRFNSTRYSMLVEILLVKLQTLHSESHFSSSDYEPQLR
jgi:hypothetical protein